MKSRLNLPLAQRITGPAFVGRYEDVISYVFRRSSALTRATRVEAFKFGITNEPWRRFRQEHSRNYDRMFVLYHTSSIDWASDMERELIWRNKGWCDNKTKGGDGDYGNGPYFVYVAVRYPSDATMIASFFNQQFSQLFT